VKNILVRFVLLAAILVAGFFAWHALFPSPEKIIRKQLTDLATAASFASNESPLAKLSNSSWLAGFFTQDAVIVADIPGHSLQTFSGRDQIAQAAFAARSYASGFSVKFLDIVVKLDPDKQSAAAEFTARAQVLGESDSWVQEIKLILKKVDGKWLITHAEAAKTF
jgi:ketosteroid isomerase-like protein